MRPVHKADNLPPSCAVVTKSGDLNFVEPSGPVTGLLYLFLPNDNTGEYYMALIMWVVIDVTLVQVGQRWRYKTGVAYGKNRRKERCIQ